MSEICNLFDKHFVYDLLKVLDALVSNLFDKKNFTKSPQNC